MEETNNEKIDNEQDVVDILTSFKKYFNSLDDGNEWITDDDIRNFLKINKQNIYTKISICQILYFTLLSI